MNEEPSSQLPIAPLPPAPSPEPGSSPPFWLMFFLGILLPIVSGFLCAAAQAPWPLFLGAVGAFVSLPFRGWRGLFAGYLAAVALAVLVVIMICGSSHPSL